MKVLDGKQAPYTPSWAMKPDYLTRRFLRIKKEQEAEQRKAAENDEQQNTRPENW